jgi:hypothetical protein
MKKMKTQQSQLNFTEILNHLKEVPITNIRAPSAADKWEPSSKSKDYSAAYREIEIFETQRPIIKDALTQAYFRKTGLIEMDYDRDNDSPQITIDLLADIIISLHYGRKIKKKSPFFYFEDLIREAICEIDKVFTIIKENKPSSFEKSEQKKLREIALEYYDENLKHFNLIKRDFLQDFWVYSFRAGQASEDFEGKLLQKIVAEPR